MWADEKNRCRNHDDTQRKNRRVQTAIGRESFPEMVAIMQRSTGELNDSVASRSIPAVNDTLPAFSLPDSKGNSVSSADLLKSGPLVVTFFRGMW